MISKRWRPFLLAGILILLLTAYVVMFKTDSPRGFRIELSNLMFLWGISLLAASSVYVTRFFGYIQYFQKWFRPRSAVELQESAASEGNDENGKRDPSLVYASLLLIAVSILITL
jgi:hypothetical protein